MAPVSHELRGPLHAILGLSEVLLNSNLNPADRRLVEALHREAGGMRVLVDDVVAYGQFNSAAPTLTEAPFAPRTLVTSVVDRLRSAADDAGLRLLIEFDESIPLRILGDSVRFGQVVDNLVSNAIRYTETGSVQVVLRVEDQALTLVVRDTGVGMSGADLETVFEPFVRVEGSRVGGTGLGLAVVKKISEVMNGDISVASVVGAGTTFVFSMPCRPVLETVVCRSDQSGSAHGMVLVVEDSEINRTLALKQLEILGLSAVAVESGEEALEYLGSESVDLVLMDWNLPGVSGLETATAIREQGLVLESVPIVAMTANVLAGDRDACLRAGMNDHLGKPVTLEDMRRMMEVWLVDGAESSADQSHEATNASVRSAIDRLIDDLGDADTVGIVIDTYLGELSSRTELLLNPNPESLDVARRAAHTLRSTSALLGADKLAELCHEFEQADIPDAQLRDRLKNEIAAVDRLFADHNDQGVAA